jgi:hypothetical protein
MVRTSPRVILRQAIRHSGGKDGEDSNAVGRIGAWMDNSAPVPEPTLCAGTLVAVLPMGDSVSGPTVAIPDAALLGPAVSRFPPIVTTGGRAQDHYAVTRAPSAPRGSMTSVLTLCMVSQSIGLH